MTQTPRDHARQLKGTVSAAYAASVGGVHYDEFMLVAASLGLRPVQGRLTRRQARRVLGYSIADTAGPKRLERLQSAAQMGLPSLRNEPDGP